MSVALEIAARALPRVGANAAQAYAEPISHHPYTYKGHDNLSATIYAANQGTETLHRSTDGGSTWSASLGIPSTWVWWTFEKVVRFGSHLYAIGYDDGNRVMEVYRTDPAVTPFTWIKVLTGATGSKAKPWGMDMDGLYLYAAEYGDPTGGPSLYRTGDGTNWTRLFTQSSWRHIHCVAVDTYTGNLWTSQGDGITEKIRKSTDYGVSWSYSSSVPQTTQLDFSRDFVYGAGDAAFITAAQITKDLSTWRMACSNFHGHLVPWDAPAGQGVFFGSWTGGSATIMATEPTFVPARDVGATVRGPGIPAGTIISSVSSGMEATMSKDATASVSNGTFVVERRMISLSDSPFGLAVDNDNGSIYIGCPRNSQFPAGGIVFIPRPGGPATILSTATGPTFIEIVNGVLWAGTVSMPVISLR